ncbi:hypothetical protein ACWFRJ_02630 [Streptomyces sp. NPDC055239]
MRDTSFKVLLDEHTVLVGLTGTVFGPAHVVDYDGAGVRRELAGLALQLWLNERGAMVRVLN